MKVRFLLLLTVVILTGFVFGCKCDCEQTNNNKLPNINALPPCLPSPTVSPTCCPKLDLITLIKKLQKEYVRESYGIEANECFTDVDLKNFERKDVKSQIERKLRQDTDFALIVNEIKNMPPDKRQELLDTAQETYKPTWRELGLDPNSASREALLKGQTDAGQKAEKIIAETVVRVVKSMVQED